MGDRYMEYQMLVQQLQQLQENINALEKHMEELSALNDNLGSLSEAKNGSEILMPFGGGIFLRGNLVDNKNIVMNVGSGVCVDKGADDARGYINNQFEEVKDALEQMQTEAVRITSILVELQKELQSTKADKKV